MKSSDTITITFIGQLILIGALAYGTATGAYSTDTFAVCAVIIWATGIIAMKKE